MTEPTPIQKLDYVLSLFQKERGLITLDILYGFVNSESIYTEFIGKDELLRIIRKLLDDKLIIEHITVFNANAKISDYYITYDGYLFDGYQKQKEIEEIKIIVSAQNETRTKRNEHRLVVGTWLAGIVGALLLLWQIFLYLYPVHRDFPYWIWQK